MRSLGAMVAHRFPHAFVARSVHYHRPDILSQEEVTEYAKLFDTPLGAEVFFRILRESLDPGEHATLIAELRARKEREQRFSFPLLLLWAKKDVMVPPSFGERFAEDIPEAVLEWMEDSSHFVHVDSPEQTVRTLLRFDGAP
jgi:pimeloyl-ACP methyl ester carboxylesterase